MSKLVAASLGITLVGLVGAAAFIYSRKATAAEKGRMSLRISPDCMEVEILDLRVAAEALEAAALYNYHDEKEPAWKLLVRSIGYITQCPVLDGMKIYGIPGIESIPITVGMIKAKLGDMSVEEGLAKLRELQ